MQICFGLEAIIFLLGISAADPSSNPWNYKSPNWVKIHMLRQSFQVWGKGNELESVFVGKGSFFGISTGIGFLKIQT